MNIYKKTLLASFVVVAMAVGAVAVTAYVYQSATYSAKYVKTASVEIEENVATIVSYATSTAITDTSYSGIQLVDVSNINMYPHPSSGEVRVSQIDIAWEAEAAASTTLLLGTIAQVTPAGLADVNWFEVVSFDNSVNDGSVDPYQRVILDYSPGAMKLGNKDSVTSRALDYTATTTGFLSNSTLDDVDSTSFATTSLARFSPLGINQATAYFGPGDLVAKVLSQTGTASTTIKTIYHVK